MGIEVAAYVLFSIFGKKSAVDDFAKGVHPQVYQGLQRAVRHGSRTLQHTYRYIVGRASMPDYTYQSTYG